MSRREKLILFALSMGILVSTATYFSNAAYSNDSYSHNTRGFPIAYIQKDKAQSDDYEICSKLTVADVSCYDEQTDFRILQFMANSIVWSIVGLFSALIAIKINKKAVK